MSKKHCLEIVNSYYVIYKIEKFLFLFNRKRAVFKTKDYKKVIEEFGKQ